MLSGSAVSAVLPVVDLERAKTFYGQTLGLTEVAQQSADGTMFSAGSGTTLFLYQRGRTKADHTVACFRVDDIEAVAVWLRTRGVTLEEYDFPELKTVHGIATRGNEKAAWFKDTEGNILGLSSQAVS